MVDPNRHYAHIKNVPNSVLLALLSFKIGISFNSQSLAVETLFTQDFSVDKGIVHF